MRKMEYIDLTRIREEYFKRLSTPEYPARVIKRVEVEAIEDFCKFLIEELKEDI